MTAVQQQTDCMKNIIMNSNPSPALWASSPARGEGTTTNMDTVFQRYDSGAVINTAFLFLFFCRFLAFVFFFYYAGDGCYFVAVV